MSDDLTRLENWVAPLLAKLSASEVRKLNNQIARELRRSQQQRIRQQQNPDGTPFAPRKKQPQRSKKGRIKRSAMFGKIRTARYLRLSSDVNRIGLSFTGRIGRIARVHQYGLRDRPAAGQKQVQYDQRQLLGFSAADRQMIEDLLIQHLTSGS